MIRKLALTKNAWTPSISLENRKQAPDCKVLLHYLKFEMVNKQHDQTKNQAKIKQQEQGVDADADKQTSSMTHITMKLVLAYNA